MDAVRPRWSSSSFLLYAGALVVLAASVALLGWLSGEYGEGAFLGWSALVFVILAAVATAFELSGDRVAAGLFAFVSLIAFAIFTGSFIDLIGLNLGGDPFDGFDVGRLLLYLVTAIAAFVLLARFQFPLLVLPGAFTAWLFLLDLVSGGGNWTAVVAILVGLLYLAIGVGVDSRYGFWLHVLAGFSIGVGVLYLWHDADWEWILVAVVALLYLTIAGGLERSSYAVYGAIGLFLAWAHFVEDWVGGSPDTSDIVPGGLLGEGASSGGGGGDVWQRALLYGLYGVALVVIGLWLDRRRRTSEHVAEPAAV